MKCPTCGNPQPLGFWGTAVAVVAGIGVAKVLVVLIKGLLL